MAATSRIGQLASERAGRHAATFPDRFPDEVVREKEQVRHKARMEKLLDDVGPSRTKMQLPFVSSGEVPVRVPGLLPSTTYEIVLVAPGSTFCSSSGQSYSVINCSSTESWIVVGILPDLVLKN